MERVLTVFLAFLALTAAQYNQQNGDVRLVSNDGVRSHGRLEIFLKGVWGTVKYSYLISQEGVAQAVCRQLGYYDEVNYGLATKMGFSDAESNVVNHLENVECDYSIDPSGAIPHILRCDYDYDGTISPHDFDMGVECDSDTNRYDVPYDTEVRLISNTTYSSAGFLEIAIGLGGNWGPVCNMNSNDADSACRQLGYTNAVTVRDYKYFVNGSNDTLADKVDSFSCTSSHPCLRSCFDYSGADVSVYCRGMHSYVRCTFTKSMEDEAYGTLVLCSSKSHSLLSEVKPID